MRAGGGPRDHFPKPRHREDRDPGSRPLAQPLPAQGVNLGSCDGTEMPRATSTHRFCPEEPAPALGAQSRDRWEGPALGRKSAWGVRQSWLPAVNSGWLAASFPPFLIRPRRSESARAIIPHRVYFPFVLFKKLNFRTVLDAQTTERCGILFPGSPRFDRSPGTIIKLKRRQQHLLAKLQTWRGFPQVFPQRPFSSRTQPRRGGQPVPAHLPVCPCLPVSTGFLLSPGLESSVGVL